MNPCTGEFDVNSSFDANSSSDANSGPLISVHPNITNVVATATEKAYENIVLGMRIGSMLEDWPARS